MMSFDVVLQDTTIDDDQLRKIEQEIPPDIFCYLSKDRKTLTLKGSNYEKLSVANNKSELIFHLKHSLYSPHLNVKCFLRKPLPQVLQESCKINLWQPGNDLQKTIVNCLKEAEIQNVFSVALPVISSGKTL
jgi:hypothetical protein